MLLFLTLDTFSRTGGIQQYNRCLQLALCRQPQAGTVQHWSLHDRTADVQPDYSHLQPGTVFSFRGFANQKAALAWALWRQRHRITTVILGHANLLPLCALLPRRTRIVMVAHGVEVWRPLARRAERQLHALQAVWCVSEFTRQSMLERHPFLQGRTHLLPNCLDPLYAKRPVLPATVWNKHWRLDTSRTYLLTLARLQPTEQAKGYDQVIAALPALVKNYPNLGYILAGKWDTAEYTRIRQLADAYGVADRVLMPGYVAPESLPALYALARVFVMPSSKEGFGIVYLEAAWQGCRVVAADSGGAPEALLQGKLGRLCPANDAEALQQHLSDALQAGPLPQEMVEKNRQLIQENFGFAAMVQRVAARLAELYSM